MNMVRIVVAAVVVLSGCLVPVDVASADGGGVGGGGGLADGGGDAGTTGSCSAPQPQAAGPVTLFLAGCQEGPLVVTGPNGSRVDAGLTSDSSGTTLSFAELPPGLYTLTVNAQILPFEVYERQQLDAGIVRTYVDRLDTCDSMALTEDDRLICVRPPRVWVYETDGGHYADFLGEDVSVAGHELWSRGGGGIERRVEGPAGLVLEGSLVDPRLGASGAFGETSPGRSIRGGQFELIEFTWDAGTMSSRSWFVWTGRSFAFRDGETIWSQGLCTLQPGCQDTSCPTVVTCPFNIFELVGFSAEKVWVSEKVSPAEHRVAEVARPIDPAQALNFRSVPLALGSSPWRMERPVFRLAPNPADPSFETVILVEGAGGATHFRLMSERILLNGPRWVVSSVGPFTVRFTPTR